MNTIKQKTTYILEEGKYKIYVKVYDSPEVFGKKKISVCPINNQEGFIFEKSKPEDIRAIAILIGEAGKL